MSPLLLLAAQLANPASAAPVCEQPPMQDGASATAGVGQPCSPREDARRKAVVQVSYATTASDGTFSGPTTGDYSFPTQPSYIDAKISSSSTPFLCGIGSWTASGYSGKCFQLVSTTLPSVLTSIYGLTVSPVSNAAGGQTVRVVARQ